MAIAISFFGVLFNSVLSVEAPVNKPFATIIGSRCDSNITLLHNRGETLNNISVFVRNNISNISECYIFDSLIIGGTINLFLPDPSQLYVTSDDRVVFWGTL